MKKLILFFLVSFLAKNASADYGSIDCRGTSKGQKIKLSLDEVSDVDKETITLSVNSKKVKISQVNISQTDYGILSMQVHVGDGPSKYKYLFKNLGSNQCFGVYGSKQKGAAYVEIINSLGIVAKVSCTCGQD